LIGPNGHRGLAWKEPLGLLDPPHTRASNMDTAVVSTLVSHHEGSQTNDVAVGRPITGRTSGRPIRTPPPRHHRWPAASP